MTQIKRDTLVLQIEGWACSWLPHLVKDITVMKPQTGDQFPPTDVEQMKEEEYGYNELQIYFKYKEN